MATHFTDEQIQEILNIFRQNLGHQQYIGARYVPIFGRKGEDSIEWDDSAPYEPLTIVLHQGNSFTSRQYVPAGIDIDNNDFWAETGNYNAQIEQYRQEVLRFSNGIANKPFAFDTVAEMKEFNGMYEGAICHTNGFYESGDGGAAWYVITENDSANEMDIIQCGDYQANLIILDNECSIKQIGAKENINLLPYFKHMLTLDVNKINIPEGEWVTTDTLIVNKSNLTLDFDDNAILTMTIRGTGVSSSTGTLLYIGDTNNNTNNRSSWNRIHDVTILNGIFATYSDFPNENCLGAAFGAYNLNFIGCRIRHSARKGITVQYEVDNTLIQDCVIENCDYAGITIESNTSSITGGININKVKITGTVINNSKCQGIAIAQVDNVLIENCSINGENLETIINDPIIHGNVPAYGIYVYKSKGIIAKCNEKVNCPCVNLSNSEMGIVDSAFDTTNAQTTINKYNDLSSITNCKISNSFNNGYGISNASDANLSTPETIFMIENCAIECNGMGIRIYKFTKCIINACTIINSNTDTFNGVCIQLVDITTREQNALITNNILSGKSGIRINAVKNKVLILGCIIIMSQFGLDITNLTEESQRPLFYNCKLQGSGTPIDGVLPEVYQYISFDNKVIHS